MIPMAIRYFVVTVIFFEASQAAEWFGAERARSVVDSWSVRLKVTTGFVSIGVRFASPTRTSPA